MEYTTRKHSVDNPKHKEEQVHNHTAHEHPSGYYHSRVPHVHQVKYKNKKGETKTYKYPYEIINRKLRKR